MDCRNARRLAACVLFLLALGSCRAALAASSVFWIFPPQNSVVRESLVTLRGSLAKPPAGPVSVVVRRPGSPTPFGEATAELSQKQLFTVTVTLAPGRNDITLGDSVLSLYYQPEGENKPLPSASSGFRVPFVHAPTLGKCTVCHSVYDGELMLNDELPALCLKCHKVGVENIRSVTKVNEHSKKITPFCVGCHDSHGSFSPKLMKREGDSCTRCHTDYTNRSGHDKAKAQPCTVCHDPHQSAYDKMLRTPAPDLCANCHEDVTGKTGGTHSLHAPVAKEGCFRCHVSHVQNTPKLLRATDPELCVECHPNVRLPSHEKAFPRCGLCHKPHLSDEPRLLASDKFPACSQCHKDPGTGPNVHKALKDSTCLACHSPHRKMAASSVQEVCGKCHNVSSETFSRPHGGLPFEKVDQCLLCHLPHAGEGRRGLLSGDAHYPIKSGGCGVCHVGENGKTVLRYAGSENCVRCHGDTVGTSSVMDKEKVHRPITQQDCVACHDPHLRRRKAMLIEEPMVLCDFCHGAVVRMGSVKHGVFKNGDCLTCHSPHFSEDRPLLKKPQPDLCFDCHPDAAPRDVSRDPLAHGALKGNRCGSCHSPHTSEDKKLIRESRDKACASCHVEILKDKKGNPWANLHGPVGTGTCTACHYMGHRHRKANDAFLLTSPPAKVCEDCHEVTNEHIPANDRLRMTRIQGGCLGCHSPHGAGNGLMLKDY